jgi:4-hydroxy-4-methyl-2-oxoglutarate aldolase
MPIGFRGVANIQRPNKEVIERFREFGTADLSDAMNMANTMDRAIGPAYTPMGRVVGSAVTVSIPTGSQNVRKVAMNLCQTGDILVINGFGAPNYALLGDNLGKALQARRVAGVIIDGAFRDPMAFREIQFPVFARSVTTIAGPKEGPGEVNVPIACGNVVVNPGDIVVADEDGIVVIPRMEASVVLERVARVAEKFAGMQEILNKGQVMDADEVVMQLKREGFSLGKS